MTDYTDNVLLTLREIVRTTTNKRLREVAKHAADELDCAIVALGYTPTRENLQTVNGLWAIGQRIIDVWTVPEPTPPRAAGGSVGSFAELGLEAWDVCGYKEAA